MDMHEFEMPAVIRLREALDSDKSAALKCFKLLFCGTDITLSLSRFTRRIFLSFAIEGHIVLVLHDVWNTLFTTAKKGDAGG